MANKIPDLRYILTDFARHAVRASDTALKDVAQDEVEDFRKRIDDQMVESFIKEPLSEKYAQWKARNHLDPRVMVRTGHYKKKIQVHAVEKKARVRAYRIGFLPSDRAIHWKTRRPIAFTLHKLALVQEYGTTTLPKRPHWRPQLKRLQRRGQSHSRRIRKHVIHTYKPKVRYK